MEKNDIFTFIADNGAKVTAIVIDYVGTETEQTFDSTLITKTYLCYAQNRLFYHIEETRIDKVINGDVPDDEIGYLYMIKYHSHDVKTVDFIERVLVDYCNIPEYNEKLKEYEEK